MDRKLRAYHKIRKCYVKVLAIEFNDDGPNLLKFELNGNIYMEIVANFIIERYTGLEDKNGVEICEGDIIKDTFGARKIHSIVVWSEDLARFMLRPIGEATHFHDTLHRLLANHFEVIGNIHENPELFKEEK